MAFQTGAEHSLAVVLICMFLTRLPEKAMAPHSSTLAWKIPWMEEPADLAAAAAGGMKVD